MAPRVSIRDALTEARAACCNPMSAVPVAGWETSVVLQELGKAIAVSFAYTLASWYLLPRREFHGSPLYNWLSCLPIQLVAFPACVALCVASRPETQALGEWLVAPWSELDGESGSRAALRWEVSAPRWS